MKSLTALQKDLILGLLGIAACLIVPWFVHERYWLGELITLLLYAAVAIQWNVLLGHAGVFSLGQMLFFAIGSYSVAMASTYWGISPWVTIPLCGFVASLAALAIGAACLRLETAYVALLTFAVVYMVYTLVTTESACFVSTGGGCQPLFGGTNGFSQFQDFGFRQTLRGNWIFGNYYVALAAFAISLFISFMIIHGRLGLAFRAMSDSRVYAASRGISHTHYKLVAFVVTSFVTAMIGAVYAAHFRFAGPSLLEFSTLLFILSMVIVGGPKSTWGPVLGAVLMMTLNEAVRPLGDVRNTVSGAALVVCILLFPKGLAGWRSFRKTSRS